MTLPGGQEFAMIPAPADVAGLQAVLGEGGSVKTGASGDTLLTLPGGEYQSVIFEPELEPAPEGVCTEVSPGDIRCDWSGVPADRQPGVHINPPSGMPSRAVYADGTSQKINSALLQPAGFVEQARGIPGMEVFVSNRDGTFDAVYMGQSYHLAPLFGVEARAFGEGESAGPAFAVNSDLTLLTYTMSEGGLAFSMTARIETGE